MQQRMHVQDRTGVHKNQVPTATEWMVDAYMQNQLDRKMQFNGGYVQNPTARTLPRIVGYSDHQSLQDPLMMMNC